jgi:hypothetical protein
MGLYIGSKKRKISLDGAAFHLNLFSINPITNGLKLLSSDGYILKDSNGLYLTSLEDSNEYLIAKEEN